jgi:hypothetical protein
MLCMLIYQLALVGLHKKHVSLTESSLVIILLPCSPTVTALNFFCMFIHVCAMEVQDQTNLVLSSKVANHHNLTVVSYSKLLLFC